LNPYTRTLVLPDYIDLDRLNLIIPQEHQGVTFGWKGTARQLFSMKKSGILMAFEAMLQMRTNARILFSIDHPESVGSLNLPANQIEITGWGDQGGWYSHLSNIDIGLFPRIGELEQRGGCSSILEFMALKIPWIASQGPAVYDFQSYGWIVENTPESWLKAAVETVDYLEDYRAEARVAPYLYAISKSLEENVQSIVDTYVRLGSLYSTRPLTQSQQKPSGRLIMAEDQGLDG
jgi:glycosyltransferase involved in cell wall biosynthesis